MNQHSRYERVQHSNFHSKERHAPDLVEERQLVVWRRFGIKPEIGVPRQRALHDSRAGIRHRVEHIVDDGVVSASVHYAVGNHHSCAEVEGVRLKLIYLKGKNCIGKSCPFSC